MKAAVICMLLGLLVLARSISPAEAQTGTAHHAHAAVSDSAAVQQFLEQGRNATERYRDQRAAITDGYRVFGPDFPGMGEHWVSVSLLVRGQFDASRPQVLSYAQIGRRPTLVGVGYAIPLAEGQSPPDFPSPGGHAWHDHAGSLDEESVLLHQTMSGNGTRSGIRLALLHAWVWLDNPAGIFESDNWALPYARLGVAPPGDGAPPSVAKLLSLASGGEAYYRLLIHTVAKPDSADDAAASVVLAQYRDRVQEWLKARSVGQAPLNGVEVSLLVGWWASMWLEINRALKPESAARLRNFQQRQHCAGSQPATETPC